MTGLRDVEYRSAFGAGIMDLSDLIFEWPLAEVLVTLTPPVFGALSFVVLWQSLRIRGASACMIFVAAGCVTGYLLFAFHLRLLDHLGLAVFRLSSSLFLMSLIPVLGFRIWNRKSRTSCGERRGAASKRNFGWGSGVPIFFSLLCVLVISGAIYNKALIPEFGWDGLGSLAWSTKLINYEKSVEGFGGKHRQVDGAFPYRYPRHPANVHFINAYEGYALHKFPTQAGFLSSSIVLWIATAVAVFGFMWRVSRNWRFSLIGLYFMLSIPLLENHAAIGGYADNWVALSITLAASLLLVGIESRKNSVVVLSILLSMVPILVKSSGLLYTLAFWLSSGLAFCRIRKRNLPIYAFFLLLSLTAIAIIGSESGYLGLKMNGYCCSDIKIYFAGYSFVLSLTPATTIFSNNFWALYMNQSFTIIPIFWLLICCGYMPLFQYGASGFGFFIILACVLLTCVTIPQLLSSEYAARFAHPASDVGNSRFLMSCIPVLVISCSYIFLRACRANAGPDPQSRTAQLREIGAGKGETQGMIDNKGTTTPVDGSMPFGG